jgi:hypothetical protein
MRHMLGIGLHSTHVCSSYECGSWQAGANSSHACCECCVNCCAIPVVCAWRLPYTHTRYTRNGGTIHVYSCVAAHDCIAQHELWYGCRFRSYGSRYADACWCTVLPTMFVPLLELQARGRCWSHTCLRVKCPPVSHTWGAGQGSCQIVKCTKYCAARSCESSTMR